MSRIANGRVSRSNGVAPARHCAADEEFPQLPCPPADGQGMTTIDSSSRSCMDPALRRDLAAVAEKQSMDSRPTTKPGSTPSALPDHYGADAAAQAVAAVPSADSPLSSAACKLLPDAVLDHQANALRSRLGKPAEYAGRGRDAAELKNVEGELQNRQVAKQDAAREAHGGVMLCKRVADLPGKDIHGAEHWWLQTARKSAGMGPSTGNIPGHGESLPESFDTKLVDHSNEAATSCTPVKGGIDEDCVDRELSIDTPTGTWIPGLNDCHTVVKRVIDKCHDEAVEKALIDTAKPTARSTPAH
jgi:hypothetical protein